MSTQTRSHTPTGGDQDSSDRLFKHDLERERESGAAEDALQDFDCAVSVSVCLSVWSLVVFCLSVGPPRMNDVADAFCAGWC